MRIIALAFTAAFLLAFAGCGSNNHATAAAPIVAGTYQATPFLNPHINNPPVITVTDLGGGMYRCDIDFPGTTPDQTITLPANVLTYSDDGKHSYFLSGGGVDVPQFLDIDHVRYLLTTAA